MSRTNQQMRMFAPDTEYERILVNEFTSVVSSTLPVALSFVTLEDGDERFYQVELGPSAAGALREIVISFLTELQERIYKSGIDVHLYHPATTLDDHQLEYFDSTEQHAIKSHLTPLESPKRLQYLDEWRLLTPHLSHYVISLQIPNGPWLHCFRRATEGVQPQRRKIAIAKGHGAEFFDILSEPTYFLDPHHIDCMWRGSHIFIVDKTGFEQIFDLQSDAQEAITSIVHSVEGRLPFSNTDDFLLACARDRRMASKVARMKGLPHLDRLSIERAKLAKDRFDLDIEFECASDGTERLKFAPKYKWQYVSILGDEYLTSPMTDLDYESNSKRPIRKRSRTVASHRDLQELPPRMADVVETGREVDNLSTVAPRVADISQN